MVSTRKSPQPQPSSPNLLDATVAILRQAFELAEQKSLLPNGEYLQVVKDKNWHHEDRLYLQVAAAFAGFDPEDLEEIEPNTLFRLAKNPSKYGGAIDEMRNLGKVTQPQARSLIKKCRKPRTKKSSVKASQTETVEAEEKTFTQEEVDKKIHSALIKQLRQIKETQEGEFARIRLSALQHRAEDIQAIRQNAKKIADRNEELEQKVRSLEGKLQEQQVELNYFVQKNEELEQKNAELELALETTVDSNCDTTSNIVEQQHEEVSSSSLEEIVTEFGSVVEKLGCEGWNKRCGGYRDRRGTFFTGLDAIAAFIRDFATQQLSKMELEFP